jgi:hypothetical protein
MREMPCQHATSALGAHMEGMDLDDTIPYPWELVKSCLDSLVVPQ